MPASDLYDTLLIESNHGFPLPEWTKNVYPDRLKACRERAFRLTTETPYMKRMRGGPIITAVHDRMVSYLNGSSDQNIITYAAHDTTISNALTSMGIYNQTDPIPDYGALLAFEMYGKPDRKSAYIQVSNSSEYEEYCQFVLLHINSLISIPHRWYITRILPLKNHRS